MASVKFPRKEFENLLGKKIDSEIEEKIGLFGTPLDSLTEEEMEVEVFPNRPDLLSLQRYVKSLGAFLGMKDKKEITLNSPEKNYSVKIDSSVKNTSRPYTVCAIVKNLNFTDEKIKDLVNFQEKLHSTLGRDRKKIAIGIYPLDKIKLPIKYTAMNPKEIKFRPLDSKKEMDANQILRQHPKGKAYSHLLSEDKKYPVFIDANKKILSMPPIINSEDTGKVSLGTKEVFVECSGTNPEMLEKTMNILISSLGLMGGKIYQMKVQDKKSFLSPSLRKDKISLNIKNVNKTLGLDLKEKEIKELLERMEHSYSSGEVSVAPWRTDILHEIDLVEDIAIAYGYDKLVPEIPKASSVAEESKISKLKSKISEILIGLSLTEISTYHLIKEEEVKKDEVKKQISLKDSKTEYKYLRQNMTTSLLRILSENTDSDYPQRIFEIGKVFSKSSDSETGIKEEEKLIIGLTPGNFTDAKQVLDYLMSSLVVNYELEENSHENLITGRTANVRINNKNLGFIGEVHPETLRSKKLKLPLSVLEINITELLEILKL